jgi:TetR/AcrR family transcriptional regulator, copper-responsive repressor
MENNKKNRKRGRPKTLDKDTLLNVAMFCYWKKGPGNISVNEICKTAKISKPGFYREFGGEDGLMRSVLVNYEQKILEPNLKILELDRSFKNLLGDLISFITNVDDSQDNPKGCLLVKMRESQLDFGKETQIQITNVKRHALKKYENWIERSKEKGEFTKAISSRFAATYIDAQISSALSQLARGEKSSEVKKILSMAFSVFLHHQK